MFRHARAIISLRRSRFRDPAIQEKTIILIMIMARIASTAAMVTVVSRSMARWIWARTIAGC
jgi:hypothetical protein